MNAVLQFKCLADPVRLRILHLLARRGPRLCVCDIVSGLALPQSTVSRHLMVLRHAGLVQDRRSDIWVYYSVVPDATGPRPHVMAWLKKAALTEPALKADLDRYDALRAEGVTGCARTRRAGKRVRDRQVASCSAPGTRKAIPARKETSP